MDPTGWEEKWRCLIFRGEADELAGSSDEESE